MCKTGPWTGAEYRFVHEARDAEQAAALLCRDVAEVRRRMDVSYDDYYRRHRCPASPERPDAVKKVAWQLYEEGEFYLYVTDGELEAILLEQTRRCFAVFDASRWCRDLAPKVKFVKFFRVCLRRRLATARRKALEARSRTVQLRDIPERRHEGREIQDVRRSLFGRALSRLEARARRYVRLRILAGLRVADVAERIGVSTRTLYNSFSLPKLASSLREKVREVIFGSGEDAAAALVGHWHDERNWGREAIAGLICGQPDEVDRLLARCIRAGARSLSMIFLPHTS